MPPVVIDLRVADDSRDVVHRAVQALAEGKVVAFPTETTYALGTSALFEEAVEKLRAMTTSRLTLAVKSADDALDYVPKLSSLGMRLARRCWPGPVTLVVDDNHPESLVRQLRPSVQQAVAPDGAVALRVPAHQAILDVLRLLAGPVAMTNAGRKEGEESLTADEVLARMGDDVQLVLDDGRSRFGQCASVVRLNGNQFTLTEAGVVSQQTLKRLASAMYLFVCTGNTCRSPMAEAIFRHLLSERLGCKVDEVEDKGVMVMSAGIAAMMGARPAPEGVTVLSKWGLDLTNHESQPLTEQLVRHADVIFAMTRSHRQAIVAEWPDAVDRVRLVCHDGSDIADPIGGPVEQYQRCANQIRQELELWAKEVEI